jgi:type VI protein secretion system component VasF
MRLNYRQSLSLGALFVGLQLGSVVLAQDKATSQGSPAETIPHLNDQEADANPARSAMEAKAKQQRLANEQKQWLADAAKLMAMSNDLKAALEKSGNAALSVEAMQKAADIEKLAKKLKDEMRNP